MNIKRCPECIRPLCQRIISIDDTCSDRYIKYNIFRWEEPIIEPLNEIKMPDYVCGAC